MSGTVPKSAVKRQQPKGGSRKGKPNKVTKALKDMILGALDDAGGQEYLKRQARKRNPAPFMALVGKVLPMQITGEDGGPLQIQQIKAMSDEQLKALIQKIAGVAK